MTFNNDNMNRKHTWLAVNKYAPYPNIKFSRPYGLGNAHGIYECTGDVEDPNWNDGAEGCEIHSVVITVSDNKMNGWDNTTQTESNECT